MVNLLSLLFSGDKCSGVGLKGKKANDKVLNDFAGSNFEDLLSLFGKQLSEVKRKNVQPSKIVSSEALIFYLLEKKTEKSEPIRGKGKFFSKKVEKFSARGKFKAVRNILTDGKRLYVKVAVSKLTLEEEKRNSFDGKEVLQRRLEGRKDDLKKLNSLRKRENHGENFVHLVENLEARKLESSHTSSVDETKTARVKIENLKQVLRKLTELKGKSVVKRKVDLKVNSKSLKKAVKLVDGKESKEFKYFAKGKLTGLKSEIGVVKKTVSLSDRKLKKTLNLKPVVQFLGKALKVKSKENELKSSLKRELVSIETSVSLSKGVDTAESEQLKGLRIVNPRKIETLLIAASENKKEMDEKLKRVAVNSENKKNDLKKVLFKTVKKGETFKEQSLKLERSSEIVPLKGDILKSFEKSFENQKPESNNNLLTFKPLDIERKDGNLMHSLDSLSNQNVNLPSTVGSHLSYSDGGSGNSSNQQSSQLENGSALFKTVSQFEVNLNQFSMKAAYRPGFINLQLNFSDSSLVDSALIEEVRSIVRSLGLGGVLSFKVKGKPVYSGKLEREKGSLEIRV